MYNKQLDVFVKAATLGSFSKAAQELFITPSAVIQQINSLEVHFGARLFDRSRRGITLTPAGSYLFKEATSVIDRSAHVHKKLLQLDSARAYHITLAVSLLHRSRLFHELWHLYAHDNPDSQLSVINLHLEVYNQVAFSAGADLIEGLDDGESWQRDWQFLPLGSVPLAIAAPKTHPLATRTRLTPEDLEGKALITICEGMSPELDRFASDMTSFGVSVHRVRAYEQSVFSRCSIENCLLQTPLCWHDIHPNLITIPCDWDYALPYGIWYRKAPSEATQRFLDFVRMKIADETFASMLLRNL